MHTSAIVLAAGSGTKMTPYDAVRSKTTLKIAGIPLLLYNLRALADLGTHDIVVVTTSRYEREIGALLPSVPGARLVLEYGGAGSADSLAAGFDALGNPPAGALVLYGDTIVDERDLRALCGYSRSAALLSPMPETSRNWVGAQSGLSASGDAAVVTRIGAHERGELLTHVFAGFFLTPDAVAAIRKTPDYFQALKVGVGAPRERYLEAGLVEYIRDAELGALFCGRPFYDIDKPWHMLAANAALVDERCGKLKENELAPGAEISKSAEIRGFVRLGKNSRIGERVLVKGNLIVGDDTEIDNGAVFEGNAVVGDSTSIRNYCKIGASSSIGSQCVVDHGAELLGGMLMDRVYFCHYGEFYGAVGSFSDLGAATVCGTLRFDDGDTIHSQNGRKEIPRAFANACYIGNYCRTGVNAVLMPGCKIGPYSVVGAGVILERDLPPRSLIRVKQEQIVLPWGEGRYGW